ncbi:DNA replication and repair protein RecO [Algoriphagus boseongensis]|uniref:DNA repair protein RecO n=1 Tax=Algoriphagus boseongensis TaxID=1442587 RepID=A0A4R6T237_9BACT|nr:DNA repair protein RecO [Algoriphagus boseongensis]TDQ13783.1 DNA replication and repair protein RecO [Algoriphagus boseongensis]
MIKKTAGIVLSSLKYKETSIIVKIFTRELGLKSYLVNGVRTQGKGSKMAFYQPLTLLDLVVYDKENSGLQRISEAKLTFPQKHIPFDFSRTSVALFMTEVISRSIFENYQNEFLFDFLEESIQILDQENLNLTHFPIVFLLEKAKYLGFGPEEASMFLIESKNQPFSPEETKELESYISQLLEEGYHSAAQVRGSLRKRFLDFLVDYYSEHLDNPSPLKSLPILRQLIF